MRPELTVIEEHQQDGEVVWLLSTEGSNPKQEECLQVKDREEAFRIKRAYDRGDIMPFLRASGCLR